MITNCMLREANNKIKEIIANDSLFAQFTLLKLDEDWMILLEKAKINHNVFANILLG